MHPRFTRRTQNLLIIAALAAASAPAAADYREPEQLPQPIEDWENPGDIELEPVVGDGPRLGEPSLIGGHDANAEDWPATVYSRQGNSRCTATLVAPRALLIAAHCVGNGREAAFTAGDRRYTSTCTHSPDYRRDVTADWALCLVSEPVTGVPFERLARPEEAPQLNETILLTGYGCTRPGGGGGNDGIYRVGEARVVQLPVHSNDFVTRGGAALCFGDSGGPAFRLLDPAGKRRVQVSVNSRGDIRSLSFLSAITTAPARAFIESWARAKGVRICGLHRGAQGCRGA